MPKSGIKVIELDKPLLEAHRLESFCDFLIKEKYTFRPEMNIEECNWFRENKIVSYVAFFKDMSLKRQYRLQIDSNGKVDFFLRFHEQLDVVGEKEVRKIKEFLNQSNNE